jgi:hypothetical protein
MSGSAVVPLLSKREKVRTGPLDRFEDCLPPDAWESVLYIKRHKSRVGKFFSLGGEYFVQDLGATRNANAKLKPTNCLRNRFPSDLANSFANQASRYGPASQDPGPVIFFRQTEQAPC